VPNYISSGVVLRLVLLFRHHEHRKPCDACHKPSRLISREPTVSLSAVGQIIPCVNIG
jgi:hypothetical protein